MNLAAELLAAAAERDPPHLDEKLFFEVFASPQPKIRTCKDALTCPPVSADHDRLRLSPTSRSSRCARPRRLRLAHRHPRLEHRLPRELNSTVIRSHVRNFDYCARRKTSTGTEYHQHNREKAKTITPFAIGRCAIRLSKGRRQKGCQRKPIQQGGCNKCFSSQWCLTRGTHPPVPTGDRDAALGAQRRSLASSAGQIDRGSVGRASSGAASSAPDARADFQASGRSVGRVHRRGGCARHVHSPGDPAALKSAPRSFAIAETVDP